MICRCSGRIEASTPQSVKDEMEIDVFDEIATLTGLTSDYMTDYKKALWLTYRYRMIANCDLEYWEQIFADALAMKLPIYDALMAKWADLDPTDTAVSSYDLQIDSTPMEGTDGDVTVSQSETYPIRPVDTSKKYLTNGNTTTYAPNHTDHHVYRAEDGLNATTFAQMMDDIESPLMRFVDEFDRFFLNRWYR